MDEALGSWEAAALMGVHWCRPAKMAAKGLISSRIIGEAGERAFAVYSRDECEQNFQDYVAGNTTTRRPRTALDDREFMLRELGKKGRVQIRYGDAISIYEAAKLLGVWWTLISRLVKEGKITGRVVYSGRQDNSRMWIISRESCEAHRADIARQEQAGTKKGRPRRVC